MAAAPREDQPSRPSRPSGSRRPRRAVTGRAIVLGTLIVLILVVLAAPVNRYFASRGALGDSARQLQQDRSQLAALRHQVALWSDPAYIQAQARRRLQYAMPGDRVYVVVDPGKRDEVNPSVSAAATPATVPWNRKLWSSVQNVDAAGAR